MTRFLSLAIPLLLAACANPLAQCKSAATKDLAVVQELIADTELSLARGYAIQTEQRSVVFTNFCFGGSRRHVGISFCHSPQPVVSKTPVAIDPVVERRKLRTLRAKEAELTRQVEADLRICEQKFPS